MQSTSRRSRLVNTDFQILKSGQIRDNPFICAGRKKTRNKKKEATRLIEFDPPSSWHIFFSAALLFCFVLLVPFMSCHYPIVVCAVWCAGTFLMCAVWAIRMLTVTCAVFLVICVICVICVGTFLNYAGTCVCVGEKISCVSRQICRFNRQSISNGHVAVFLSRFIFQSCTVQVGLVILDNWQSHASSATVAPSKMSNDSLLFSICTYIIRMRQ